jgi:hypothetical protein
MEENLCQLYISLRIDNQHIQGLKKLNSQKISDPIQKWVKEINRVFFKGRCPNSLKTHEEMLNIPGHKGNANQNDIKIPPHSCQNDYHQEKKQQ